MVLNNQNNKFYQSDLDLHPMTLVLKLDPDIVKMSHHTNKEVSMSRHSKVTDTQTDRHTQTYRQNENITFPQSQVVKIVIN